MSCRRILRRGGALLALSLGIVLFVADRAQPAAPPKDAPKGDQPVTIRHDFKPGRLLRYHLQLAGETAWVPPVRLADWGQMVTNFTFTLRAKTLWPDGACTFDLVGEALRSAGRTPGGRIDVAATRGQSALGLSGRHSIGVASATSPLDPPMTITLGTRGQFRFATGLLPLAIYALPHVDPVFWTLLCVAPEKPVAPGENWEVDFAMPVPGAQGKPLRVQGDWKVLDRQRYGPRNVLPVELAAKLDLKDSEVLLKNGERIHVAAGSYVASGRALWDPEAGLLCEAAAEQTILITADRPVPRELRSQSKCTLKLLGVQDPR
jgi:hypothetical protein